MKVNLLDICTNDIRAPSAEVPWRSNNVSSEDWNTTWSHPKIYVEAVSATDYKIVCECCGQSKLIKNGTIPPYIKKKEKDA